MSAVLEGRDGRGDSTGGLGAEGLLRDSGLGDAALLLGTPASLTSDCSIWMHSIGRCEHNPGT